MLLIDFVSKVLPPTLIENSFLVTKALKNVYSKRKGFVRNPQKRETSVLYKKWLRAFQSVTLLHVIDACSGSAHVVWPVHP